MNVDISVGMGLKRDARQRSSKRGSASRPVQIVKSTGEIEQFDERKLRESLRRAGAAEDDIHAVLDEVRSRLRSGMSTRKIYGLAYRLLRKRARPQAGRYALRRSILKLGPTGFSFEKLVAASLVADGWETTTNTTLSGSCVSHEIDVLAVRGSERVGIECKYHNRPGRKSDLKVALYVKSRAEDLVASGAVNDFWLVTNTAFTSEARRYAECAGLELRGLDEPEGKSLRDLFDRHGLYPITCLSTLKRRHARALLDRGVALTRQIADAPEVLRDVGLGGSAAEQVLGEIEELARRFG